jgi:hypothetical protein
MSLIKEDIKEFRAKHCKEWLKLVHYTSKVHDAQVHNLILNPLLAEGFIHRQHDGYIVADDAHKRVEKLRRKRSGPKPIPTIEKFKKLAETRKPLIEPPTPDEKEEADKDEWDTYISKKLKKSIQKD